MFQKLLLFLQVLAPGACGRWDMRPMPMKSSSSCPLSAGTGSRGTRSIPPGQSGQTPFSDTTALIPALAEFTQSSLVAEGSAPQMQQLWRRPGDCPPCGWTQSLQSLWSPWGPCAERARRSQELPGVSCTSSTTKSGPYPWQTSDHVKNTVSRLVCSRGPLSSSSKASSAWACLPWGYAAGRWPCNCTGRDQGRPILGHCTCQAS